MGCPMASSFLLRNLISILWSKWEGSFAPSPPQWRATFVTPSVYISITCDLRTAFAATRHTQSGGLCCHLKRDKSEPCLAAASPARTGLAERPQRTYQSPLNSAL